MSHIVKPDGDIVTALDTDDLRLTWLEGARAEYEAKRNYFQLLMDTTDKLILEIHKKKAKS